MGNSLLSFRGKYLSGADYYVAGWLYFLACEVDELREKPSWLLDAQDYWNSVARIEINIGTIDANLDKYVTDDERLQVMLQLAQNTLQRLKNFGESIKPEQIRDLGNLNFVPNEQYQLIDPISHFGDANPVKLWQFGTLFCELLQGTLHPAKKRIMRGYGGFRIAFLIDYLETLIPDGQVGSGIIHLDEHGEKQVNLYPAVYWYSEHNSAIKLIRNPDRHPITGIADLIIDYYPFSPWDKEAREFYIHELYGLQEHWFIEEEEHTVTVRRLVNGKLVVVETLHAGEQFASKSLGGKIVDVNLLLRME